MVKVKKAFSDRYTGNTYQPGDLYSGDAARITELREAGYLNKTEMAEPGPVPEPSAKKTKAPEPA